MKEIKFRAWNKEEKFMEYCADLTWFESEGVWTVPQESSPWIVMQFTGLFDKNEKQIYEGDILEWKSDEEGSSDKYEVTWNEEKVGFRAEWLKDRKQMHAPESDFEVIGNIYENPDLLK